MAMIKIPAARVRQGLLVLYTVALQVRQLISSGFYTVEAISCGMCVGPANPRALRSTESVIRIFPLSAKPSQRERADLLTSSYVSDYAAAA